MNIKSKKESRDRRRKRIRAKVSGTALKPRLSVFKSNKFMSIQLIDDEKCITIASVTTKGLKGKGELVKSKEIGLAIGKTAIAKKIDTIVFDRGGYIYTGAVKAVAEGAREAGLKF
jgi:large subunit ribosomal protein L18